METSIRRIHLSEVLERQRRAARYRRARERALEGLEEPLHVFSEAAIDPRPQGRAAPAATIGG